MEDLWSNDKSHWKSGEDSRNINSPLHISNFSVNLDDNNMDYILEQQNFEEVDDYIPRSPASHIQSSDTLSNTPSMSFAGSTGTSSSRGSKRKGPTMDKIDEHFALLNTNIQQCVSSMKDGNQTVHKLSQHKM